MNLLNNNNDEKPQLQPEENNPKKRHKFDNNFAIIIGINKYTTSGELKGAVNDAKRLAIFLGSQKRKPDERYKVLLLEDEDATHDKITNLLNNLKKGIIDFPRKNIEYIEYKGTKEENKSNIYIKEEKVDLKKGKNRLLFYFAGHDHLSKSTKSTNLELTLKLQDEKDLPLQELITDFQQLQTNNSCYCQHLLMILDCCYGGAAIETLTNQETVNRAPFIASQKLYTQEYERLQEKTFTILTSGGYTPVEDTGKSSENSTFLEVLLQALQNGYYGRKVDSNDDYIITIPEIYNYIVGDNRINIKQHPQLINKTQKDIVQGQYFFLLDDFDEGNLKSIGKFDYPYKGLFSYEKKDEPLFCGRDELVKELLNCLYQKNQKFTILTGASGSGKSSIVKAGLIPILIKGSEDNSSLKTISEQSGNNNQVKQWEILEVMRPGVSPLTALAKTLLPIYDKTLITEIQKLSLSLKKELKYQGNESEYQESTKLFKKWTKAQNDNNKRLLMLLDNFDKFQGMVEDNQKSALQEVYDKIQNSYKDVLDILNRVDSKKTIDDFKNKIEKSKKLLLVIDQFEELITLSEKQEKELFLNLLLELESWDNNLYIVVTVRSDFEIYFREPSTSNSSKNTTESNITDISQCWNKNRRLVIKEMNSEQLRQAIIVPTRRFIDHKGRMLDFESEELVSKIIDDVRGMPGGLALLSFTLDELYRTASAREDNPIIINTKDYEQLDGISGALTKRVTEAYNELLVENQDESALSSGKQLLTNNVPSADEVSLAISMTMGFPVIGVPSANKTPSVPKISSRRKTPSAGEVRQAMMKQLILRMTTTQRGRFAKRPVPKWELKYPDWRCRYKKANERMEEVIQKLIEYRLIVSYSLESEQDGKFIEYVEPAHDALILDPYQLFQKQELKQEEQRSYEQNQDDQYKPQNQVKSWGNKHDLEEILALRDRLINDVQKWQLQKQDTKKIFGVIDSVIEFEVRNNVVQKIKIFLPKLMCFVLGIILVISGLVTIIIDIVFLLYLYNLYNNFSLLEALLYVSGGLFIILLGLFIILLGLLFISRKSRKFSFKVLKFSVLIPFNLILSSRRLFRR